MNDANVGLRSTYKLICLVCVMANVAFGQFSITNASVLPSGLVGSPYSQTLVATGGTNPITFTLSPPGQALPPGVNLDPSGVLSGTPTSTSGLYSFTVRATDSSLPSASFVEKTFSLTVIPALSITDLTLPTGTAGVAYSKTLQATGGLLPYIAWEATGLPQGLFINNSGVISGTPTSAGTFTDILITVRDSSTPQLSSSRSFSITINAGAGPTVTTATPLPQATITRSYTRNLTASGGSGAITWSLGGGTSLPSGLTLTPAGSLSGAPNVSGTFSFIVRATDASNQIGEKSLSLTINTLPVITTGALPNGSVGVAYQTVLQNAGGTAPFTWAQTFGTLPSPLTFTPASATIAGTPTSFSSTPALTFQLTDANGAITSATFSLNINPALTISTPSPLPAATVNTFYSQNITANGGGSSSYIFLLAPGSTLPSGMSLTTQGVLSGTPTVPGSAAFTIQVTDGSGLTATKLFQLTVNPSGNVLTITSPTPLPSGAVNSAYSTTLEALGGTGTGYVWTLANGSALPPGLTLSQAGVIGGNPTSAGSTGFTVQVADSSNAVTTKTFVLTINNALIITTATPLPSGSVNAAYSQTLGVTGGSGVYTWALAPGSALPAGLSISNLGVISGSPSAAASLASFTVQVTDSANVTVTKAFQLTINASGGPLTISTASPLPAGTINTLYNQLLIATGGSGTGYGFTITVGSLPNGMSLSTAGLISGTPTAATTVTFTVQVTDSANATTTKQFQLTINQSGLNISTAVLPDWTQGAPYNQTLTATGASAPLGWSIIAGQLPLGLQIGQLSGAITGTPTVTGNFSFTVQVADSVPFAASKQFSMVINAAPSIVPSTFPGGVMNSAYTAAVTASGGTTPYVWGVATGQLPAGLSINTSTGAITGTPTATGNFQFTLRVTDAAAAIATRQFTINVAGSALSITTSVLTNAVFNTAYTGQLAAAGGSGGYNWTITQGSLPTGLSLTASTGAITGTATSLGQFPFTVTVTDSVNTAVSRPFTMTVLASGLVITSLSLPEAVLSTTYTTTVAATGGSGAGYVWSLAPGSGVLPPGLNLSPTGQILGTPILAGTSTVTLQVTDSLNTVATKQFVLAVATSPLTITSSSPLPEATQNLPYSTFLQSSGGVGGTYLYTLTGQGMPQGLALSGSGTISGIPAQAGLFSFTVQVIDGFGGATTKVFSLLVKAPNLSITTTQLSLATPNTPYSATLAGIGGAQPYIWTLIVGALPPGLTLNEGSGTISGTPTNLGAFNFRIQLTDAQGTTAFADLSIQVVTIGINTTSVPDGQVGVSYSVPLEVVGGSGSYSWTAIGGQLPPGLNLASSGLLIGTPTTVGQYVVTIEVRDSANAAASRQFTINVANPTIPLLQITTQSLPGAAPLVPYSQALTASGGTPPYTWVLGSGILPAGFTLSAAGVISGTPLAAQAGSYQLGLIVADSASKTASKNLTLVLGAPAQLVIVTQTLPAGNVGVAYSQSLASSGGVGAINWTLSSGVLPPGVSLSSAGAVAGTPTTAGSYGFTVQASDAGGTVVTRAFTVSIGISVIIQTTSLPTATVGQVYATTLSAAGGTAPYAWTLSAGALPTGLTISAAGLLSGTPTVAGDFRFTLRVQDSATPATNATREYTINAVGLLRISTLSLPGGIVSSAYSVNVQAAGGDGAYTWSQTGLPDGLAIDPVTGAITGTPTRSDTFYAAITVRDALNRSVAATLPIVVQSNTTAAARQSFVAITPCRVMETRTEYNFQGRQGGFGPPSMNGNETRTLVLPGSNVCQIPTVAKAFVLNVTLIPRNGGVDFATIYSGDENRPESWTVRSPDGQIVANSAIVRAGAGGSIKVFTSGNADILIDISGYFTDASTVSNLVYYPVTPCRVIETRTDYRVAGAFGPPSLSNQETRHFRIPANPTCTIPANAVAYATTITAVPQGPLAYLTAWPTGAAQPNVSSINSFAGRVLANNLIIPAGTDGSIDIFAFNRTDVLVDVNGYFAPDDGVNGLYYFPTVPCRVSDSSDASYASPFGTPIYADETNRTLPLPSSAKCKALPTSAKAYVLNFTALPNNSPMPFLTAYPTGQTRPNASVLNAFEGQVVSNSAIIPAGTAGSVDVFAYRRTNVVVEVLGYFGR